MLSRRKLFSSLAVAPLAAPLALLELDKDASQPQVMILPADMKLGEVITIINAGDRTIIMKG